jgi:secreted trypsin-like serine protease
MSKVIYYSCFTLFWIIAQALVVRHDVKDIDLLNLAKKYPQICHFRNGEGTLISSQWVLTAAHLGELYVNTKDSLDLKMECNGKTYIIEKVVVHPDYKGEDGNVLNDIALIKIKTPVTGVVPALAYEGRDEVGKTVVLVGRGYPGTGLSGEQKEKWDKKTRAATNKIDTVAKEYLRFSFDKPGTKNCTKYEGISGPGDSGGPAFFSLKDKLYIVGVSSHQFTMVHIDDNGNKTTIGSGQYGVVENYTRVSNYSKWIKSVVSK